MAKKPTIQSLTSENERLQLTVNMLRAQLESEKAYTNQLSLEQIALTSSEQATQDAVYLANNTKEDIHIPVSIEVV